MSNLERVKQLRTAAKAAVLQYNSDRSSGRTTRKSELTGDGKEPGYDAATFLYIRGFNADTGARPIASGQVFWDSPDIELFDNTGVRIANNQLQAGNTYTTEVTVTNDGDLDCNTCLVELFLDDPSIGFNVSAAVPLGTQRAVVGRQAKAAVKFSFNATAGMLGHRCMFARVSSFANNDLPSDWINFSTATDRHIGQQNLNVVQQGTSLDFKVHLLPALRGKPLTLELLPNMAAAAHVPTSVAGRYLMVQRNELPGIGIKPKPLTIARRPARELQLSRVREKAHWQFLSHEASESMHIDIPNLGLKANEAMPLELKLTDPADGHVIGGITLLVVG